MSVQKPLLEIVRLIVPQSAQRAFRVWRESRSFSNRPDREFLVGRILPDLCKPATTILWVGCQPYTFPYLRMMEGCGAECWTLDIDPSSWWWGHSQRHVVGDLQSVANLYPERQFDVTLVNGVFGYGLDTQLEQDKAVQGLAQVLKPRGLLMLGWNTHRAHDPLCLPAINQIFIRSRQPGFDRRITFPNSTHVYDFFDLR